MFLCAYVKMVRKEEILNYMDKIVSRYALSEKARNEVDIFSTVRGTHGTRGYGLNKQGLEIGWWVHPERYTKELEFLLEALDLENESSILSVGCGPAFHESVLAKFYPECCFVGTDVDEREIRTAQKIAEEIGVKNILFREINAEESGEMDGNVDAVISLAALHDIPEVETFARGIQKHIKDSGQFVFTYNPQRRQMQFPQQSHLEDVIGRYFTITKEFVLITPEDSLRFYGEIEIKSRQHRGYGLVQKAVVAIPK